MGLGVSGWPLAGAVASTGQMGVVSGAALEVICARRLQLGDPGGHLRRAFSLFPVPEVADRVLQAYYIPHGKAANAPFRSVPMFSLQPSVDLQALSVLASFAEVVLAREASGGRGSIGVNYMYKMQMPLLSAMYGAMLAGADAILMGAGSPDPVPEALARLAEASPASLPIRVHYADAGASHAVVFAPETVMGVASVPVARPKFLAIVSSCDLAQRLAALRPHPPDGFIIEGPTAGGHNAPPRGPRRLDDSGQPVYGRLDDVPCDEIAALGLPFWLAGSYSSPEALHRACDAGAQGVQVGTLFALCLESGLTEELRTAVLRQVRQGEATVFTNPVASPTGFPFKEVQIPGTLSDERVYEARRRICDVGGLRNPYRTSQGGIGYRCAAEAGPMWVKKSGLERNAVGRRCLCNALLANIGLGQLRVGIPEPALVTAGSDLRAVARLLRETDARGSVYSAADVVAFLSQSPDGHLRQNVMTRSGLPGFGRPVRPAPLDGSPR